MPPREIILMRHAEKPNDLRDSNLSPDGKLRAQNLVHYIQSKFGKPDFLFASAVSKHSERPIATLNPLSKAIGVPIDTTFSDQDFSVLAAELLSDNKYRGKFALICWHHGNLPGLALDLKAASAKIPNPWNPSVFDLIIDLRFKDDQEPETDLIQEPF